LNFFSFNGATTLRSWKLTSPSQLKKELCINYIKQDIDILITYIKNYIDFAKKSSLNKTSYGIIFYFPDYYRLLPKEYYRKPNKNMRLVNHIYYKYSYVVKNIDYDILYKKDDYIYFVYLNPMEYTSLSLYRLMKQPMKLSKKILVFTHIPLDYHVCRLLPLANFIDSYTGKILYNKQRISEKLFKTDTMPFNKYSHWLFGDKYILNHHLPRGKKTELLLLSSKYRWNLMSDNQFRKQLMNLGLLLDNFNFHPY